ncbi:MAG: valine--tRNA ligase [Firmicutes bacterium]|nr:valine--tRNA ligase [Bacillota bacterium]
MYPMLASVYDPQAVEERWYDYWLKKGYFRAEVNPTRAPFCIVIPPPNVTGALPLGHAFDMTLQDVLIRWRRMQGYEPLWLPGTDHAGIATQAVVERELAREGLRKEDLGREGFLARVWAWKEKYGGTIVRQLKRLGCSCDWTRERFTMDEGCSRAVREVFLRLYEKGLIYRGRYLINWCPKCRTTISDIEVEHEERPTSLWHLRYPLADGSGFIEVATTRPETMLGDTAVAVNPADERYRHLVGKTVILPLMNRPIPIIADSYVDMAFGTGAVKVTPAHDPNDWEMAVRHDLPAITVIDFDARMTAEAGPFAGLDRLAARETVVEALRDGGYLGKIEPYTHAVGQCYRCDTVIEPLLSEQWFVRMKPLAEPARRAVEEGRIVFVPERFTKIYLNWLENIRDWCISRQLWWGHRIPVWYCDDCGTANAAREEPSACAGCGSRSLTQDPDVLDTWFSSALWPFSTMGWPERTPELEYFYPTSVLVTGRDIIFFWVARMIFMGLEFMQAEPFKKVMIHGLILDKDGKKMSKSRPETSIDPQEVIDRFGADTLRFSLLTGNTPGQDLRFYWEKAEAARNFANKIWNAARFVLMNLEDYRGGADPPKPEALADRWILSRLQRITTEVTSALERYDLGAAVGLLYDFIWSEYCDWYIETAKPRLRTGGNERAASQKVLAHVLARTMQLLHPFMPFISEEIWQHLPHEGESIVVSSWPVPDPGLLDAVAEAEMEDLMEIVRAIRNIRAEVGVAPGKKIAAILAAPSAKAELLAANRTSLCVLADLGRLELVAEDAPRPAQAMSAVAGGAQIYLPLAELVYLEKERARLTKELENARAEAARLAAKLANEGFLAKAPAAVVEREKTRLEEARAKEEKIRARLRDLGLEANP